MPFSVRANSKTPKMFWIRSRWQLITVAGFLFSISTMVALPGYLNQRTKLKAENFCRSVQIDESLQSYINKCNAAQGVCESWKPVEGITRHQAWFSGIFLNACACEVRSENDKVISKYFEEHTD
jgi:hypothetical protein